MIRKTVATALALATISGSALVATTGASQAGYYGSYGGYRTYYDYQPSCYFKRVRVQSYYGWTWKKVRVCY